MARKKICFVVSAPGTAEAFLTDHFKALSANYDIYLVANIESVRTITFDGVKHVENIPIVRSINISKDLNALHRLRSYFKKNKFDAVHSVTPKAGLITALAAKSAGIPVRIHIYTGQVWATRQGAMRTLLKEMDKMIANLNTHLLTDGEAQRQFLISEGVLTEANSRVLGAGSICGANTERFTPSPEEREKQRKELGIGPEKVVFTFMGRLNNEKGIVELLEAFNNMAKKKDNAFLLIFGTDEGGCMNGLNRWENIRPGENFLYYGPTSTPNLSLQAADVFCLPSYREGFGMSAVEAACLGLPVICSDAYGLRDTMIEGETGLRCKVRDSKSLEEAMAKLYNHPALRKKMGEKGRKRILSEFTGEKIVGEWVKFYDSLLTNN